MFFYYIANFQDIYITTESAIIELCTNLITFVRMLKYIHYIDLQTNYH